MRAEGLQYEIAGRSLLAGIDLELAGGESVAVSGPSGSGKSTLLMCALGLVRPTAGRLRVAGVDITRLRSQALARHRRNHIGVVFQAGELLPELSPVENVALAALLSGQSRTQAYAQATSLLAELGVPHGETPTSRLSGGERQRTALARALINRPTLLLTDEPTGALDTGNRDSVCDLLFSLPDRWGCALLVVTHDKSVADRADRHLVLTDGLLMAIAPHGGEA
ncbi:ABC transporter ATP-binding protein [Kitasatospora sp. NPDC057223]|uniref:ABC transporter ATP-binding protein n=1 Tax=Kitasatospora sp. NPDC057223 TaxID=3346055 RepID=UPI00363EB685